MNDTATTGPAHWSVLAAARNWPGLWQALQQAPALTLLERLHWEIPCLRALGQGEQANQRLQAMTQNLRAASAAELAALGEALLHCAYFAPTEAIAQALEQAGHPAGPYLRAGCAREQGRWAQAIAALEPLASAPDPWPRLAQLARAWTRLKQGWLAEAGRLLAPFADDPHPGTQKLVIRWLIATGQSDAARARLQALAARQPDDWEWPTLRVALEAGADLAAAIAELEQALARQPRQAEAWALKARLHMVQGDEAAARAAMARALAIKPWLDAAERPVLEALVAQRRFTEAAQLLKQLRQLADTPRRQAMALDLDRLQGAKVAQVVQAAEDLARHHADDPEVLRSAAAALIACQRHDPAARLLERVLALNPYDRAARNNLAALYRSRGDLDDAIATWQPLVQEGERAARINLALALLARGDLQEAEAHLSALAADVATPEPAVLRGLAELRAKQGSLRQALALAQQARAAAPSDADNWLLEAQIVEALDGALAALDRLQQGLTQVDAPRKIRHALVRLLRAVSPPAQVLAQVQAWQQAEPQESDYLRWQAELLEAMQQWDAAEATLRELAHRDPNEGTPHLVRYLIRRGRYGAAERSAQQWLREDASDIRRWGHLIEIYLMEQRLDKAESALAEALARDPGRLSLIRQQVGLLLKRRQHDEAAAVLRRQWQTKKELAAFNMLLDVLQRAGRRQEALAEVEAALTERHDRALRLARARLLRACGQHDAALAELRQLHAAAPGSDAVAQALVAACLTEDRYAEARAVLEGFAAAQPGRLDLHVYMANVACEQGLLDEARQLLARVVQRNPDLLEAYQVRAKVEKRAGDAAAEAACWRAVAERFPPRRWLRAAIPRWVELGMVEELQAILNRWREAEPHNPEPWWAAFETARYAKRMKTALEMLEGVERRAGRSPALLSARASVFNEMGRLAEAIALTREVTEWLPNEANYLSQLLALELKAGNWRAFDELWPRLEFLLGDFRYKEYLQQFFNLNCHPGLSPQALYRYYREWYEHEVRPTLLPPKPFTQSLDPKRRLRIGYVSPDFRQHAVAKFSEPMLMAHDRDQFELYAYAHLDPGAADAWTERFKTYFHHWREIRELSIDELERQIRADQIDILVDLAGHTGNNRLSVFMRRPAPILASHIIGAGQTTGIAVIDYLIVPASLWPAEFDDCAAEQVARIPYAALVFKEPPDAPPPWPLPLIERGYVTFGAIARPVRVSERVVRVWAEILRRVPTSRLRFEHDPYIQADIQQRYCTLFAEHGIAPERVEFANTRPYWSLFGKIDLVLDPFPAASGTTTTEGLYMERLAVTLRSGPGMGRSSATQIAAIGLEDLCVADTEEEYIAKAVALAADPDRLRQVSSGLRERFQASPLMDYQGYAQALATTYRQWWCTYCAQHRSGEKGAHP